MPASTPVSLAAAEAAATVVEEPPCWVFVMVSVSDASLALQYADLAACGQHQGTGRRPPAGRQAATLAHHTYPVLSTAHCCCYCCCDGGAECHCRTPEVAPGAFRGGVCRLRHIVCSGSTDGTLAVWDVTPVITASVSSAGAAAGGGHGGQQGVEAGAAPASAELRPALALPGLHQSGINALAMVPAGGWVGGFTCRRASRGCC